MEGPADGYVLEGGSNVAQLSQRFESLIDATYGDHHQYPDGFVLYTGTLFAPTSDRDQAGAGFTHKRGDWVSITSPLTITSCAHYPNAGAAASVPAVERSCPFAPCGTRLLLRSS